MRARYTRWSWHYWSFIDNQAQTLVGWAWRRQHRSWQRMARAHDRTPGIPRQRNREPRSPRQDAIDQAEAVADSHHKLTLEQMICRHANWPR